jgi:transcription initiation factor TFIID subunit 6
MSPTLVREDAVAARCRSRLHPAHWLAVEGIQPAIPQNPSAAELQALTQPHASTSAAATAGQVDVRPLVKHVLSRELQQYFDRLTQAAEDSDGVMRQAALKCLQADTGLGDLVPYLVQWVSERVVANLSVDLANLETLLDLVRAMLDNPTLFVEPYVRTQPVC